MVHTVFDIGGKTVSGDYEARQLIPWIGPGGRARIGEKRRIKPAMMIRATSLEVVNFTTGGADDVMGFNVSLKLSQEQSLNPGLLLHLGTVTIQSLAAAETGIFTILSNDIGKHAGSIWCPLWVGVRLEEIGAGANLNVDVHLDWEPIEIEWWEWFDRWEFLDNIVDNTREW